MNFMTLRPQNERKRQPDDLKKKWLMDLYRTLRAIIFTFLSLLTHLLRKVMTVISYIVSSVIVAGGLRK
jgi:hypothetical protein